MKVELIKAWPQRFESLRVELVDGANVGDALDRAAIERPGFAAADDACAVFGERASRTTVLHDGDRIELLRPLTIDPKQARRRRAQQGTRPR